MRTAIIGGGIAGLAAAYELQKAAEAGSAAQFTLFEAGLRLGGSLSSEYVNGALLEHGADSFLSEKPAAAELCRELGLGSELIGSNDAARKTFIVVKNRLVPLPDGLMFLVPTKIVPTLTTRLFSLSTKLRMGLDLLRRPRAGSGDESIAALVERHYGREAVDRLADPLLSGIYGGDSAQLSARTVLPRFVELEQRYGSLTRGILQARRGANQGPQAATARSIFTTLRGGMQQLVDALAARVDRDAVRLKTPVTALRREGAGWLVEAGGFAGSSNWERFDAVIVATPAWAAAKLLKSLDPTLGDELAAIPYSSSVAVNLLYDEASLGTLPQGFGFLVPTSENRALLACTFAHRKFAGRAPAGNALLRAFLGGIRNEGMLDAPDEVVVATVRRELREILGITANPEHVQVARWRKAMAQYAVGHQQRIRNVRERLATHSGLRLVGNAYDGIGIPDCIRLGRGAARELMQAEPVVEATR